MPAPNTTPPNPTTESATDGASIAGLVSLKGFTSNFHAKTIPTKAMTAKLANTRRHEPAPTSAPASVGPIAGANITTSADAPMAAPTLCRGKTSNTIANVMGRTSPVPMPCIARPTNAMANEGAAALTIAPTRKAPSANRVSLRAENHFMSRPANGNTTPITSI